METITKEDFQNLCNQTELDPVNMVDPDEMVKQITNILSYMDKQLGPGGKFRNKNDKNYENHMCNKFQSFVENYPFIFYKIIRNEDISPLLSMLQEIRMIKKGVKTFEESENNVVNGLLNKYVKKNIK
ncbi:hypothetical protein Hokovirus_3_194 [Hokovirus HKV1]|uniref:Uncharacterized protein n=1 Tax=Hokovirus HKV1 TaxID=1977638 RepID=A0A1V0SGY2_9VIRU|nr:hypothetical protein Hokovirus_3_194 [Hokovirus HKV1]